MITIRRFVSILDWSRREGEDKCTSAQRHPTSVSERPLSCHTACETILHLQAIVIDWNGGLLKLKRWAVWVGMGPAVRLSVLGCQVCGDCGQHGRVVIFSALAEYFGGWKRMNNAWTPWVLEWTGRTCRRSVFSLYVLRPCYVTPNPTTSQLYSMSREFTLYWSVITNCYYIGPTTRRSKPVIRSSHHSDHLYYRTVAPRPPLVS